MKLLLLTLDTFSRTGGIQQFNRSMQLALSAQVVHRGGSLTHLSLVDSTDDADNRYISEGAEKYFSFRGFKGSKPAFIKAVLKQAGKCDHVLLGHVNLLPLLLLPGLNIKNSWLVVHGVEVWQPLSFFKNRGLQKAQKILTVSRFTMEKMQSIHGVSPGKLVYFPNCIDPFYIQMPLLPVAKWNRHWRLDTSRTYLLSVTRLAHTEAAKGYDEVIRLLPQLAAEIPNISYLLAGKADEAEYERIRSLAESLGVNDRVLLPGFVPAESLPAIYHFADCFVLPSKKEGFGIVFLEAAWWGCPIIGYASGGVPEALLQGKLGNLIPMGKNDLLFSAILNTLKIKVAREERIMNNRMEVNAHYSFELFLARLSQLFDS
jgi:glycosyltransferase involved in cell wall biosynthesis